MQSDAEVLGGLLRLFGQTLALSLLFVGSGRFLRRKVIPGPDHGIAAFAWAEGYFLGLVAFLALFVPMSRVVGARAGLWLLILAMFAATVFETARSLRAGVSLRGGAMMLAVVVALAAGYCVVDATLWLTPILPPATEPGLFSHFGSIHSGRYANYAIFIAQDDRVPFLAQNGGQSMLAAVHLLLGAAGPLGALMAWLAFSLAFLTLLLHGLFRENGASCGAAAGATFLVMFCNIAISAIHLLVFDNGSPLGFAGYTDMVVAVATFLLLVRWMQGMLALADAPAPRSWTLPGLLGLGWSWLAPQNVVVAVVAFALAVLAWKRRHPSFDIARRMGASALAFALAVAVGAVQFGTFLPKSLREETGYWTQEVVELKPTLRPYIQYLRSLWNTPRWNTRDEVGLYERAYAEAKPHGPGEIYRSLAYIAEEHFWSSLRIYGFPLLGLTALGLLLRRARAEPGASRPEWEVWWMLSTLSFVVGYGIYYLFELGNMKWWLTRFLVPGSTAALVCLGLAAATGFARMKPAHRVAAWAILIAVATVGPMIELATVAVGHFVVAARVESLEHRLGVLVRTKGPFLFDALQFDPRAATRDGRGWFVVGGPGRQAGLAVYGNPMPLRAGLHRVGFRIELLDPGSGAALLEVAVTRAGTGVLAQRRFTAAALERAADGAWAWLDFDVPAGVKDARFEVHGVGDGVFVVSAMHLENPEAH
jgi:hypothetical protein